MNQERLETYEQLATVFSLIPLKKASKHPIDAGWTRYCIEKRKFVAEDFIEKNAGVACGPASGVIVVDIDNKERFEVWCKENNISDPLPETYTVQSGMKGHHYYYQYPNDGYEYRSTNKGCFDIRGVGGFVVAPGSIHPDTFKMYVTTKNVPIQPAPDWVLDMVRKDNENEPVDLENLRLSQNIKALIIGGKPKGKRSECIMKVIIALVSNEVDEQIIKQIFYVKK